MNLKRCFWHLAGETFDETMTKRPTDISFTLTSLEDTARLASSLARHLEAGQFLALCGDLGAGKTTFTRHISQAMGCTKLATSPTFALFQSYPGGTMPFFHADLYRLGSEDELFDLGWEETLAEVADGLAVVEWADKFPAALPADYLRIEYFYDDSDSERRLNLSARGARSERLLGHLETDWRAP